MMEKAEKIWIASMSVSKNISRDDLYWSDYMIDNEEETDSVWVYVEECKEIGTTAFKEKYADFDMYNNL